MTAMVNPAVASRGDSAVAVGQEVIEAARNQPRWHAVARQMVHAWNDGMRSLREPKKGAQLGLDAAIEQAGFSDPQPAEMTRSTLEHSPLLGAREKK